MKIGNMRRALVFASVFNLLVAIYFIIISSISLVQLRWYHQLTITLRVRNVVTSATSYFAFLILIFVALVFIIIFVLNTIKLKPKSYVSTDQDAFSVSPQPGSSGSGGHQTRTKSSAQRRSDSRNNGGLVIRESASLTNATNSNICCSTLLHLVASASLIIIIVIWLLNSGELVRDSISSQLDLAFAKYQFANRSNHYSIAIDGMQDINNCCGSLDYTDFPHQRTSGLSSGHYPGSCCGKNIFGVNARVICQPEEIVRAKQTVSKPDPNTL